MSSFFFWIILACASAFAESESNIEISDFLSNDEVLVELGDTEVEPGTKLAITSRIDETIIGYVEIEKLQPMRRGKHFATGKLLFHSKNAIPLKGDRLRTVNFLTKDNTLPGRTDLLTAGQKKYSSRYKHLYHQGLQIGETAATLDQGEVYIDILSQAAVGVTNNLTLESLLLLYAIRSPNFGIKYRLIEHESFTLTPAIQAFYPIPLGPKGITASATLYVDILTNTKLISHTALTYSYARINEQDEGGKAREYVQLKSSISSGYEYIRDNWNRVLMGPRYYFDKKTIGGYISYMWVSDSFHIGVGVMSNNLSKFTLSLSDGYWPEITLYWRI